MLMLPIRHCDTILRGGMSIKLVWLHISLIEWRWFSSQRRRKMYIFYVKIMGPIFHILYKLVVTSAHVYTKIYRSLLVALKMSLEVFWNFMADKEDLPFLLKDIRYLFCIYAFIQQSDRKKNLFVVQRASYVLLHRYTLSSGLFFHVCLWQNQNWSYFKLSHFGGNRWFRSGKI